MDKRDIVFGELNYYHEGRNCVGRVLCPDPEDGASYLIEPLDSLGDLYGGDIFRSEAYEFEPVTKEIWGRLFSGPDCCSFEEMNEPLRLQGLNHGVSRILEAMPGLVPDQDDLKTMARAIDGRIRFLLILSDAPGVGKTALAKRIVCQNLDWRGVNRPLDALRLTPMDGWCDSDRRISSRFFDEGYLLDDDRSELRGELPEFRCLTCLNLYPRLEWKLGAKGVRLRWVDVSKFLIVTTGRLSLLDAFESFDLSCVGVIKLG